jgi:transposase-like protein
MSVLRCLACGSPSRVITRTGRDRLRECEQKHRWTTVELKSGDVSKPATKETAWTMRRTGKTIRAIASDLHVSTATVQMWMKDAPTLEGVWR